MAASARALHYVLKIGDRAKNMHFFRNVLGMKVSRGISKNHLSIISLNFRSCATRSLPKAAMPSATVPTTTAGVRR